MLENCKGEKRKGSGVGSALSEALRQNLRRTYRGEVEDLQIHLPKTVTF